MIYSKDIVDFIEENHKKMYATELAKKLNIDEANLRSWMHFHNYNYKKVKRLQKLSKRKKEIIIDYFLTHEDNRIKVIAEKFNLSFSLVSKTINEYLDKSKNYE